jgi:hypothetical protein
MTHWHRVVVAVAGLTAGGCSKTETSDLAGFEARELRGRITSRDEQRLTVELRLSPDDSFASPPCPLLESDVHVEVAGQSMALFRAGGYSTQWIGDSCDDAIFNGTLDVSALGEGGSQIISIWDDSARIELATTSLEIQRRATPREEPVAGAPGDLIAFDWTPVSDVLALWGEVAYFDPSDPSVVPEEQDINGYPAETIPHDGFFEVKLPAEGTAAAAYLKVNATAALPIESCSGTASCSFESEHVLYETRVDVDLE